MRESSARGEGRGAVVAFVKWRPTKISRHAFTANFLHVLRGNPEATCVLLAYSVLMLASSSFNAAYFLELIS